VIAEGCKLPSAPRERPVRQTSATEIARHWPVELQVTGPKKGCQAGKCNHHPSTLAALPLREPARTPRPPPTPASMERAAIDARSPGRGQPENRSHVAPSSNPGAAIQTMRGTGGLPESATPKPRAPRPRHSAPARCRLRPQTFGRGVLICAGCSTPCVTAVASRTPRLEGGRLIVTPTNHT
jgi:hypothetical protein